MQSKRTNIFLFLLGVVLMAGIFSVEVYTKVLGTVTYLIIVLYMLWLSMSLKKVVTTGTLATILLITGYILVVDSAELKSGTTAMTALLGNRAIAIAVVWIAVFFTLRYRKSHAAEVQQRSQLYSLFNNATEGMFILNARGEIGMVNAWAMNAFGYTQEELTGAKIELLVPDRLKEIHRVHRARFVEDSGSRPMGSGLELYGKRKNGTEFPIEVSLSQFTTEEGLFVIAFVLDITERKKSVDALKQFNEELETRVAQRTAELTEALRLVEEINKDLHSEIQVRKRVEEKLNASQALYNAMTRNFPEGWIGVLDREYRYLLVDGEELAGLGWTARKLIGKKITDVIKPFMSNGTETSLRKAMMGEKVSFDISDKEKSYNIHAVPLPDLKNEVNEILVVIRNVTERVKYEEGLKRSLEKEKELGELKSRFVTMASHEFRTPLTTILSSAFLLESYTGEKYEKEKSTHIGRIKRAAKVLTEILNDFLSLGKLDEGHVKPAFVEIRFEEFIHELIKELESLKHGNQSIAFHHSGDGVIWCDKQLLRTIISNLVSNGLKYSGSDDQITIESATDSGELSIQISDQGMGIPKEEQKHIFKRFYRAHNAANIQGTGLGLNIVKKYARLLNGNVSFESELNKGTTFTVTVPANRDVQIKMEGL